MVVVVVEVVDVVDVVEVVVEVVDVVVDVVVVGAGGRFRITRGTGRGTASIAATVWTMGSTKRTAPGSMIVHRSGLQMWPPSSSRTVT